MVNDEKSKKENNKNKFDKNITGKKDETKEKIEEKILEKLESLNYVLNKNRILELIELTGNTKKYLIRNFLSGITKGVGAGIGFSIITALIIYFLQKIIKLNIPVISQYISDIIEIVQKTR